MAAILSLSGLKIGLVVGCARTAYVFMVEVNNNRPLLSRRNLTVIFRLRTAGKSDIFNGAQVRLAVKEILIACNKYFVHINSILSRAYILPVCQTEGIPEDSGRRMFGIKFSK